MALIYQFDRAIVRQPAPSVVHGLRAVDRGAPDFDKVCDEHRAYVAALEQAGVTVEILPPLPDFPDSLFVEDPALVFTAGAILLRPGAPSREGETHHILPALERNFSRILRIEQGYADGGDVLALPDRVMIGLSARTDLVGAQSLAACLAQLGLQAEIVSTPAGVLHFKTDCSLVDAETILATPRLAASGVFRGFRQILTEAGEEAAANALRVNDSLLVGADFPRTAARLAEQGLPVCLIATGEIGKVDAGLSCMSLRWQAAG